MNPEVPSSNQVPAMAQTAAPAVTTAWPATNSQPTGQQTVAPTGPLQTPPIVGHLPNANLPNIPSVTTTRRPWLAILSLTGLFVSLVGAFILYFTNVAVKSDIKATQQQIDDLTSVLHNDPYVKLSEQLVSINSALTGYKASLAKQVDFSTVLSLLPTKTPKEVSLSTLTIDEKGSFHVGGKAASFDAAGKALQAFKQLPFLQSVKLDTIAIGTSKDTAKPVTFGLSATLLKDSLKKKTTSPSGAEGSATPSSSVIVSPTAQPSP